MREEEREGGGMRVKSGKKRVEEGREGEGKF